MNMLIEDPVRTDMNCTNCSKNFIAQLDMSLDGNHVVECPYCGHEHCRVVKAGKVTGDRWESRQQRHDVHKRNARILKKRTSILLCSAACVQRQLRRVA